MGKKKESDLGLYVKAASLMPWWLSLAMAVVVFLLLDAYTQTPVFEPGSLTTSKSVGAALQGTVLHAFAKVGKFVVPLILVCGACLSIFARLKRSSSLSVIEAPTVSAVSSLSWREFESLVGEGFRLQGYTVSENNGRGPDGGIDLRMRKEGETFLVQCKHWKAFKVGVQVAREMYGLMAAHGAAGGYVVTSGRFTEEAVRFASGRNITLVDCDELQKLLRRAKESHEVKSRSTSSTRRSPDLAEVLPSDAEGPVSTDRVEKISSSKLASSLGMTTTQFLERAAMRGLVDKRGDSYVPTDAGRQAGAEWRKGYGGYIMWPSNFKLD